MIDTTQSIQQRNISGNTKQERSQDRSHQAQRHLVHHSMQMTSDNLSMTENLQGRHLTDNSQVQHQVMPSQFLFVSGPA